MKPAAATISRRRTFDIFTKFATDDLASVLSVSYGLSEIDVTQAQAQSVNQSLMQAQSQGQSVFVASGDAGAYTDQSNYPNDQPNTSEPGSQPLVTGVGGTLLVDSNSAPFTYVSESSWADTLDTGRGQDGTGGGGGISQYWNIPSYQSGSFTATQNPQGSLTMRNVPDVSLYGDYDDGGYDVYLTDPTNGPGWSGYNGTSAASPLWAAFIANVDEARVAAGKPKLGLANTAIYSLAKQSSKYATDFHDINDGSNNLFYNAVTGYDNSTGWGSFNGANLFNDLVSYGGGGTLGVASLSFTPTTAHPGDVITGTVTLTGNAPSGGAAVTIAQNGTTLGTVTVAANTSSIQFTITLGTGTGTQTFTATYNGTSKSATVNVTASGPAITSFTPVKGPVGTTVTVTGTGFTGTTSVKFNGVTATYTTNSSTQITCHAPAGAGTGHITVTTSAGTATSSGSFTLTATAAHLTSLSPSSVRAGNAAFTLTVTGTGFVSGAAVGWNGSARTTTFVSSTEVTAVIHASDVTTAGTASVTVVNPSAAASNALTFTVTSAGVVPVSLTFNPSTVQPGGTTIGTITLSAAAPTGGAAVALSQNGTSLGTITIPAGSTSAGFYLTISSTASAGTQTLSATYNGTTVNGSLTVDPNATSPFVGQWSGTLVLLHLRPEWDPLDHHHERRGRDRHDHQHHDKPVLGSEQRVHHQRGVRGVQLHLRRQHLHGRRQLVPLGLDIERRAGLLRQQRQPS